MILYVQYTPPPLIPTQHNSASNPVVRPVVFGQENEFRENLKGSLDGHLPVVSHYHDLLSERKDHTTIDPNEFTPHQMFMLNEMTSDEDTSDPEMKYDSENEDTVKPKSTSETGTPLTEEERDIIETLFNDKSAHIPTTPLPAWTGAGFQKKRIATCLRPGQTKIEQNVIIEFCNELRDKHNQTEEPPVTTAMQCYADYKTELSDDIKKGLEHMVYEIPTRILTQINSNNNRHTTINVTATPVPRNISRSGEPMGRNQAKD